MNSNSTENMDPLPTPVTPPPYRNPASFSTQANALLRKNLTYQRRNWRANARIVAIPFFLCLVLVVIQSVVNGQLDKPKYRCGCRCVPVNNSSTCQEVCGVQYSDLDQVATCPIPSPPTWPALLQVPRPEYRFAGPTGEECRARGTCPATVLVTGRNRTLAESLAGNFFVGSSSLDFSNYLEALSVAVPGTDTPPDYTEYIEPAFISDRPLYVLQPKCTSVAPVPFKIEIAEVTLEQEVECVQGLSLWRDNSSVVNDELFKGYRQGNEEQKINEYVAAYDFLDSSENTYSVNIWYNSTYNNYTAFASIALLRVPRTLNLKKRILDFYNVQTIGIHLKMWIPIVLRHDLAGILSGLSFTYTAHRVWDATVQGNDYYNISCDRDVFQVLADLDDWEDMIQASNTYLKLLRGANVRMHLEFVKEMPQVARQLRLDFSSLLGPLFYTWVVQLLFPVVLTHLVYEKQQKLKIMMKMHGLKDGPYWMITYAYFFFLSTVYILCFVIFGSVIRLKFFTLNDYSIQIVFYFIYINLQIALAILVSSSFSNVKTATVVANEYVFGSGLLGQFLLKFFVEATSFPRGWILVMEIVPGFSLYRGLYEFSQYAFTGDSMGTDGMRWRDLNDSQNGMKDVLIIMTVEWVVFLVVAYYLDQVSPFGGGSWKSPLFFLQHFQKKGSLSSEKPSFRQDSSKVFVEMERPDVAAEREVVEKLISEPTSGTHAIICDNLKKVYPGRDGNPQNFAVRGLSLALPRGECFGILGPNGAGKTSFINMMTGLIPPTSGTAYIQGLDIRSNMDNIYTSMGVCPQHDLLWDTLTGKEHLLFYGRLKNLQGASLMQAVDESLKSVNLFYGGLGNKQAGQYSGGMKRRLSVAISLIGDPKVVYMDEPSTGLDPASRRNLWNVVKKVKRDRAIILTTHSMEEAEVLCDRLSIFVDGSLHCIGNPQELKARYGRTYIFTMTTSSNDEEEVELLVRRLSPSANKIYHISGTQKWELSKQEVRIADVFRAVEQAKSRFEIHAWGLADTTLEDVFIKVAKESQSPDALLS